MATPNNVQQNILTEMQNKAIELLDTRNTILLLTQMWVNEGMTSLSDADIQTLAEFAGVTQAEALGCKQSFDALLTTLGDPGTTATVAWKFLKLANRVP